MNKGKQCKNFLKGNYSDNCNKLIEDVRPKWATYCIACGKNRSKDWKHQHPERVKSYDSDEAIKTWRNQNNWNQYIRTRRQREPDAYRVQNNQHVREHRARKRQVKSVTCAESPACQKDSEMVASDKMADFWKWSERVLSLLNILLKLVDLYNSS